MRAFVSFLFLIMAVPALAAEIPPEAAAPSVLPGITPAMRSAGYWTARHPAPDAVIMDGVRVMDFNRDLMNEGFVEDFSRPPSVLAGRAVTAMISEINDGLKRKIFFDANGALVPSGRVAAFDAEIAAVPEKVLVHYGFVTRNTDERLLPMAEPLYEKPGDIDFDQLQNSGLVVGAPVIILHQTRNGKWLFVRDAIASGWVTTDSIGLVDRDMFRERAVPSRPVVVMSARADLFSNSALTQWASMVRMGTVFSYRNVTAAAWEVEVPVRTADGQVQFVSGFIPRVDAAAGYLSFTPRNIYRQAFRLLDAPYGWGDAQGGQDCSRFLQMVYATVGLTLPRNSGEQGRVGSMLPGFDPDLPLKQKQFVIADKAVGAATILRLNGHIVLYLGSIDGKPYVIHATWAYRDVDPSGHDRARVTARVVVSDLDLSAGSQKGSLLKRVISARVLR